MKFPKVCITVMAAISSYRRIILIFVLSQNVLNNGSLWMDVFLTKEGAVPDPNNPNFSPDNIHIVRKRILKSRCQVFSA